MEGNDMGLALIGEANYRMWLEQMTAAVAETEEMIVSAEASRKSWIKVIQVNCILVASFATLAIVFSALFTLTHWPRMEILYEVFFVGSFLYWLRSTYRVIFKFAALADQLGQMKRLLIGLNIQVEALKNVLSLHAVS
jgi:hypothetical protein